MSSGEWGRLREAARDPAVGFLALLPLGLLHLSGRHLAESGAFLLVEHQLQALGPMAPWLLGGGLVLALFWAIGRIRHRELAWVGGAGWKALEGAVWGALLGPVLVALLELLRPDSARLLSITASSALGASSALADTFGHYHGTLAVAAGAGLYEELIFRAGGLGACTLLLRGLFAGLGWRDAAPTLGLGLAILLSSAAFALAHALGDPQALDPPVLAFRFLAGILLGALFAWRGLAVVAWAHFFYDALVML